MRFFNLALLGLLCLVLVRVLVQDVLDLIPEDPRSAEPRRRANLWRERGEAWDVLHRS